MSKFAIVLVAAAVLAGCAQLPQTRPEFQQVARSGGAFAKTDTFVAKRSLDDAVRLLRPRLAECFDRNVTFNRVGGSPAATIREQWQSSVRPVDKNLTEVSVQRSLPGAVQKQPEGGFYMLALDLERIDSGSTRLTFYGPNMSYGNTAWESLKQWSEGRAAACPSGIT